MESTSAHLRTLTLCALASCGSGAEGARPNLLLVTIDTLRADHCSAYGYELETTPNLDALAASGVLVEEAYAPMATTAPSHASVLTGRYPLSLGLLQNGHALDERHVTLAERLAANGYRTAAFVSAFPVDARFGFGQGFERYDQPEENARTGDVTVDRALAWLQEWDATGEAPFFLWTHLFDPHTRYEPPPKQRQLFVRGIPREDEERRRVARYDGEIHFADEQLARLFEYLRAANAWDDTLVVVTADHGEGLRDHHDWPGHGLYLYEEAVRVPLVFHWTDELPAGVRVRGPVTTVDLAPTLLALLGLDPDRGATGRDLTAALRGEATLDADHPVYSQRRSYLSDEEATGVSVEGSMYGVRVGRWKFIEAFEEGTRELYDLEADPKETENLAEVHPDVTAALSARLRAWVEEYAAGTSAEISEEDLTQLEALGYVR